MVLSCLSLTTTPCSTRFGIAISSLRLGLRRALLMRDRADAGDVATNFAHPRGVLELAGRPLETQVEPLLLELEQFVVELVDGHGPDIGCLHHRDLHSSLRPTQRVLI